MEKDNKKSLIIKIVISIVAIIVAIVCIVIISTHTGKAKYDGTVTLELQNIEGEKEETKKFEFKEGQNFIQVLNDHNYHVVMGTEGNTGMVMEIGSLKTDQTNGLWIMFKVDGVDSTVGILDVNLKDDMVLTFYMIKF